MEPTPPAPRLPDGLVVRPARRPGERSVQRAGGQIAALFLSIVALCGAVGALFVAWYVWWVLIEAGVRLTGAQAFPSGRIAFALATLCAWGVAYLALDHVALWGNDEARRALAARAGVRPGDGFFVEIRVAQKNARSLNDIGFLFVGHADAAARLTIAGDEHHLSLPRSAVRTLKRGKTLAGLGAPWITLALQRGGQIRLLSRDGAKLSDTRADALEKALADWLSEEP